MAGLRYAGSGWVLLVAMLLVPQSLLATTIISVTGPPGLSFGAGINSSLSASWSASQAYTDVSIAVLVDAFIVGDTPMATAYLTTRIGPGTTVADEIAQGQFTVPLELPICSSSSCGALVTVFSGLSLPSGTYFLTLGPPATGRSSVGWFPTGEPTLLTDTGVTAGHNFIVREEAMAYPPATAFNTFTLIRSTGSGEIIITYPLIFTVTGTEATPIPEPATYVLCATGWVGLLGYAWCNRKGQR